jgi:hypothetical protein
MNTRILFSLGAVLCFASGCGSERPAEATHDESPSLQQSAPQTSSGRMAGYTHPFARSRFHLGTASNPTIDGVYDKVIGTEGVFATNRKNGAVFAIPNHDSLSLSVAPLTTDAEAHHLAVKAYFLGAGLPAEQMGDMSIVSSISQASDPNGQSPPKFEGYSSTISRKLGGYVVAESLASARINANDEVVSESVYWPELPSSVVADAKALDAILAEPVGRKAYLSRLPDTASGGHVVIHHTSAVEDSDLVAVATYDVEVSKATRHFGVDGTEVRLPQEARAGRGDSRR